MTTQAIVNQDGDSYQPTTESDAQARSRQPLVVLGPGGEYTQEIGQDEMHIPESDPGPLMLVLASATLMVLGALVFGFGMFIGAVLF